MSLDGKSSARPVNKAILRIVNKQMPGGRNEGKLMLSKRKLLLSKREPHM